MHPIKYHFATRLNSFRAGPGRPDALVVQIELGASLAALAAGQAEKAGIPMVLNASPAPGEWSALPEALRRATDVLIVNLYEAGRLAGSRSAGGYGCGGLPFPAPTGGCGQVSG